MQSSKWLLLLVCCVCLSLPLAAQKTTGTITGVVTDQAGAVIPVADVTATNVENGATRTAKSGGSGEYVTPALRAGTYNFSSSRPTSVNTSARVFNCLSPVRRPSMAH